MKTPKKFAALATTLSLSFVLAACAGESTVSSSVSISSSSTSTVASSSETSSTSVDQSSSSESSSSDAPKMEVYKNEAFGLSFNLPEGWSFTDAATLKKHKSPIASIAKNSNMDMIAASSNFRSVVLAAVIEPNEETAGLNAAAFLSTQTKRLQEYLKDDYKYTTESAEITFEGLDRALPANITTVTDYNGVLVIGQAVAEKDGYFFDVLSVGQSKDVVINSFEYFKAATE